MMNKKNLWFLTLFSLVLVLSIYYVTMPGDLLAASTNSDNASNTSVDNVNVDVSETDTITTLKVEDEAKTNDTLSDLQGKLSSSEISADEKNKVYEEIKSINTNSGIEEGLEKKIKSNYQCEAFAKIEDNSVSIVVDKCENSKTLANNIMRLVQGEFDKKMYISVQFQS